METKKVSYASFMKAIWFNKETIENINIHNLKHAHYEMEFDGDILRVKAGQEEANVPLGNLSLLTFKGDKEIEKQSTRTSQIPTSVVEVNVKDYVNPVGKIGGKVLRG